MKRVIKAGEFKAQCLQIMNMVNKKKQSIIITKRNTPIAKLMPIEEKQTDLFGAMRGTLEIRGNLLDPINEKWNADS